MKVNMQLVDHHSLFTVISRCCIVFWTCGFGISQFGWVSMSGHLWSTETNSKRVPAMLWRGHKLHHGYQHSLVDGTTVLLQASLRFALYMAQCPACLPAMTACDHPHRRSNALGPCGASEIAASLARLGGISYVNLECAPPHPLPLGLQHVGPGGVARVAVCPVVPGPQRRRAPQFEQVLFWLFWLLRLLCFRNYLYHCYYCAYWSFFQVRIDFGLPDHIWVDKRAAIAKKADYLGDQFRPAMRIGWLAYIKKNYSADAVLHGHALGQGELVLEDDEWLLSGPVLFCTLNTQPHGSSAFQNNHNNRSNNRNNR